MINQNNMNIEISDPTTFFSEDGQQKAKFAVNVCTDERHTRGTATFWIEVPFVDCDDEKSKNLALKEVKNLTEDIVDNLVLFFQQTESMQKTAL